MGLWLAESPSFYCLGWGSTGHRDTGSPLVERAWGTGLPWQRKGAHVTSKRREVSGGEEGGHLIRNSGFCISWKNREGGAAARAQRRQHLEYQGRLSAATCKGPAAVTSARAEARGHAPSHARAPLLEEQVRATVPVARKVNAA